MCKGKLFNLLILHLNSDIYYITNSYIVNICSKNPYDHFQIIDEDILTDNISLYLIDACNKYDYVLESVLEDFMKIKIV